MKLNKKSFLAILTMLSIQFILGINWTYAMPCDAELETYYATEVGIDPSYFVDDDGIKKFQFFLNTYQGAVFQNMKDKEDLKNKLFSVVKNFADSDYKGDGDMSCVIWADIQAKKWEKVVPFQSCIYKYMAKNNCDPTAFKYSKSAASQRQSSSSGSSSQPDNKANRQSSSNLSDESKKKLNEAIDVFNKAHSQNDYANALPALKIIVANTQDKQLKASATNRLGEYYKFGYGVPKDEVKAQALFEQASMAGETEADAQICHNYLNGIGVTENHVTAIKYCTTAANSGHVIAMAQLGWIYATGTGTQNEQLAKEWTCKAAQKGHAGSIKNAKILNLNCN